MLTIEMIRNALQKAIDDIEISDTNNVTVTELGDIQSQFDEACENKLEDEAYDDTEG